MRPSIDRHAGLVLELVAAEEGSSTASHDNSSNQDAWDGDWAMDMHHQLNDTENILSRPSRLGGSG